MSFTNGTLTGLFVTKDGEYGGRTNLLNEYINVEKVRDKVTGKVS